MYPQGRTRPNRHERLRRSDLGKHLDRTRPNGPDEPTDQKVVGATTVRPPGLRRVDVRPPTGPPGAHVRSGRVPNRAIYVPDRAASRATSWALTVQANPSRPVQRRRRSNGRPHDSTYKADVGGSTPSAPTLVRALPSGSAETPDGSKPWYPDGANQRFNRIHEKVPGAEKITPHQLRHWMAELGECGHAVVVATRITETLEPDPLGRG
jgi:hypothetical protein